MNVLANNLRPTARQRVSTWVKILLATAIITLTLHFLFLHRGDLSRDQIDRAVQGISTKVLWACGALTSISFLALGVYDVIAVRRVAGNRISPYRAWLAGALANAISNTVGFHALTATAVRYRLLTRSGLTPSEVAGVTALSWTALAFGFASMFSLALTASPQASQWQRISGLLLLGILLVGARWLGDGKSVRLWRFCFHLPSGKLALAQMMLGAIEMASAIGALYVLMPAGTAPSFAAFSTLYIGAVLLGIASHAPGGLGVFEATILALSDGGDHAQVLAALLIYRLIYNICPFILAALTLAGDEMRATLNSRPDSA